MVDVLHAGCLLSKILNARVNFDTILNALSDRTIASMKTMHALNSFVLIFFTFQMVGHKNAFDN